MRRMVGQWKLTSIQTIKPCDVQPFRVFGHKAYDQEGRREVMSPLLIKTLAHL